MYSEGFRRLGGITQVSAAAELQLIHTRLTHSLKVAQVARSQVQVLIKKKPSLTGDVDATVAETAALAHDIGHPPFGHAVEEELNGIMENFGGFEGNAQSLRYVSKLARRSYELGKPRGAGALDLTRASLAAILKYPRLSTEPGERVRPPQTPWWNRMYGPPPTIHGDEEVWKWNAYVTELDTLKFARGAGEFQRRSLEAAIMDWSDDVSYAVHDIEDYIRIGLIPTHIGEEEQATMLKRLDARLSSRYAGYGYKRADLELAAKDVFEFWTDSNLGDRYAGRMEDDNAINRWVNRRLTDFLRSAGVDTSGNLVVDPGRQYEVEVLKFLTVFYVIDIPRFAASQHGQRRIIRELFEQLHQLLVERPQSLPPGLGEMKAVIEQEQSDAAAYVGNQPGWSAARSICDYLCTLTEAQALDLHDRLAGRGSSMLGSSWY